MRLIFDIEGNGLLDTIDRIHCLWCEDIDTGQRYDFADQPGYRPISEGLDLLAQAEWLGGHNILTFDLPALEKVRGFKTTAKLRDTLTISRLIWPELQPDDFAFIRTHPEFPQVLLGSHSLKAWGYRLGIRKGTFSDTDDESIWDEWSKDMHDYCGQDVLVNIALWQKIEELNYAEESIQLEHDFQVVMFQQETFGIRFNEQAAGELNARLVQRKAELLDELQRVFPPKMQDLKTPAYYTNPLTGIQYPKRGAVRAAERKLLVPGPCRQKAIPFNPGSRDQIADRLSALGWKPVKFTPTGKPQIDDEILEDVLITCNLPQAKLLAEYLMVDKRIGQLANGANAWLKLVRQGRMHGRVITNGTVTGRCTHIKPNMSQVPRVTAPYGKECRGLFVPDPGYVLLGADASGLELRCLAHFMAKYDGGEYAKVLLSGDIHSENCRAMGLDPKVIYDVWGTPIKGRDIAKTFIYGYLYGAGDEKIGRIVGVKADEIIQLQTENPGLWQAKVRVLERKREKEGEQFDDLRVALNVKGAILRATFETKTPALALLKAHILLSVEKPNRFNRRKLNEAYDLLTAAGFDAPEWKGYLRGIDGRILRIRSAHSALNTLLQSAGAVAVKYATVLQYQRCLAKGWKFGREFAFLLHVHDEFQKQVLPELAEQVGEMAKQSIADAGTHFRFRCPLAGEYRVGDSWAATH